jgi:hypothetical protein
MKYSVDWEDDVLVVLTAIWTTAPNRQAVTAAQARIDQLLASNPLGNGSPVSEGLYALVVHPLHVQYEVLPSARSVKVVSVRKLP